MREKGSDRQGLLNFESVDSSDKNEVKNADAEELKTADSLSFLSEAGKVENIFDSQYWSLYSGEKRLEPLIFSNGKTQEDIVKETCDLIKSGKKIILIHGMCGTGKSAIALNIARNLGRASIVVPVKGLQRQYEEDYSEKKYVVKSSGEKMKIAMITGRENHDSIIKPGVSCADPQLPDTIKITERNFEQIREYYLQNPLIKNKVDYPQIHTLKRISIAPSNPYWSPILPADFEIPLKDAKKKRYTGLGGRDFIFYHRKSGCSYYDQYQAYISADVIIFNAAKYKIEVANNKKPETEVDIIDEADEFLDNFSNQEELNLTRFYSALQSLNPDSTLAETGIKSIKILIELEEKNKYVLGIEENKIFKIKDTQILKILGILATNSELQAEISLDELNYASKAVEVAENFKEFLDDTYVTFRKEDKDLVASIVTTNLSKKFEDIVNKSKALVLMSGTLHSPEVLKNIFGIENFAVVEAETLHQGNIDIQKTGKEADCRYANFSSGKLSRKDYLNALSLCLEKAEKPVLIHVNAYDDLPNETELQALNIDNLMSKERLYSLQSEDKTGRMISLFKSKLNDYLFTTRCSRGVDFPGDTCNSVIFTKYPNPNINGIFWKILQETHKEHFWDFYKDKARREFLQRIYRALRSKDDHVYVLSPDSRVLDSVRGIQLLKV